MRRRLRTAADANPAVTLSELEGVRYLHLGTEWVQGCMLMSDPDVIVLEYVQRMMAWLLLVPERVVGDLPQAHAMQLGLGAGALSKACYRSLGMRNTVVELNAQVVAACRQWFRLPPASARFEVLVQDAADIVTDAARAASVDALQVDLYDQEAAAPVLDSADFYIGCHALLTPGGCMSVNLFGRDARFEASLARIVAAFGPGQTWVFRPTREGNVVVLAQRPLPGAGVGSGRQAVAQWDDRVEWVTRTFGWPAAKWMRALRRADELDPR